MAAEKAMCVLADMATPLTLSDRESLLKSATTALNSKVRLLCAVFLASLCGDGTCRSCLSTRANWPPFLWTLC